jgi:hypothetical protein
MAWLWSSTLRLIVASPWKTRIAPPSAVPAPGTLPCGTADVTLSFPPCASLSLKMHWLTLSTALSSLPIRRSFVPLEMAPPVAGPLQGEDGLLVVSSRAMPVKSPPMEWLPVNSELVTVKSLSL